MERRVTRWLCSVVVSHISAHHTPAITFKALLYAMAGCIRCMHADSALLASCRTRCCCAGEKAKRRDPRTHQYDCEMCPTVAKVGAMRQILLSFQPLLCVWAGKCHVCSPASSHGDSQRQHAQWFARHTVPQPAVHVALSTAACLLLTSRHTRLMACPLLAAAHRGRCVSMVQPALTAIM